MSLHCEQNSGKNPNKTYIYSRKHWRKWIDKTLTSHGPTNSSQRREEKEHFDRKEISDKTTLDIINFSGTFQAAGYEQERFPRASPYFHIFRFIIFLYIEHHIMAYSWNKIEKKPSEILFIGGILKKHFEIPKKIWARGPSHMTVVTTIKAALVSPPLHFLTESTVLSLISAPGACKIQMKNYFSFF